MLHHVLSKLQKYQFYLIISDFVFFFNKTNGGTIMVFSKLIKSNYGKKTNTPKSTLTCQHSKKMNFCTYIYFVIIHIYKFRKNDKGAPRILLNKYNKIGYHNVELIFM